MCDCFHLPFPNWHGSPGTGAGRRLKGPEPEDDSVCEDAPEFLEGERPRPQGSSPVNEYPTTEKYTDLDKEGEGELYDPYQKSSGSKKGKKVGFGSFFEKRSKMSQEECPESGVIVKTPKEVCAKGLVVSGGGKEGIFIKEVAAESPAAKHLSAQEGDQILSATVYFDNVSYEDALQILEHAQPYKMEFCLKRKPPTASDLESSTAERQEIAPGEEGVNQLERGRTKTQRRPDARISWPKFPSFTRGRKAHFKRSHSTSEAEEQRKLELSPPTSDTESPIKTQELGKDKKTKKQKIKLSKLKMKGVKSKSVEKETDSIVPVSRSLENVQPQQAEPVLDAQSPPPQGSLLGETAQIYLIDQQEKKEITKIKNECHFEDVSVSVAQTSQHRVELISLDKTLKTTDISDLLADQGSYSKKKSPDVKKKKKERSELKVDIQGKEKEDLSPEGLLKSTQTLISITQVDKESSAEKVISTSAMMGDADICLPKVDMSLDMSDVGLLKQSPKVKSEKHKKDRSILIRDSERYGIRPRDPMDGTKTVPKFKMPMIEVPDFKVHDPIVMTEVKASKSKVDVEDNKVEHRMHKPELHITQPSTNKQVDIKIELLKREDIEIPGMEATALAEDIQTTGSILPETGKIDVSVPVVGIHAKKIQGGMNVDVTKDTTSKTDLQTFKLPKVDISSLEVHQQITKSDVTSEKVKLDVTADVFQPKTPEMEVKGEGMKIKASDHATGIGINDINGEIIKRSIPTHKVPKIESPDPDACEPITMTQVSLSKTQVEIQGSMIQQKLPMAALDATSLEVQAKQIDRPTFKLPKMDSEFDVHEQISKRDVNTEKSKSPIQHKKDQIFPAESKNDKFKIPPVPQYDVSFPNLTSDVKLTEERETGEIKCISDTEIKIAARTDINADLKSPLTEMSQNIEGVQISLSMGKDEVKVAKASEIETENLSGDTSLSPVKTPMFEKPDLDIKGPNIRDKEPSLHMKLPELEQAVSGKIASFDIKGPNVAVEEPAIDINVASKDITIKGVDLTMDDAKTPVPKIGTSRAEAVVSVTKQDIDIKEPQVVVKGPYLKDKVGIYLKETKDTLSHMDIPPLETSKLDMKVPPLSGDITLTSLSTYEISTAEVKAPEIDVSLPKEDDSLPQCVVGMKGTDVDMKVQETTTKIKSITGITTKVKLPAPRKPQIGIKSPKAAENIPEVTAGVKMQSGKLGVKLPAIDIKEQTIEIEKAKEKIELSESKMPDINVEPAKMILKSTQELTKPFLSKPIMDIKTPEVHYKTPSLEIKAGEAKEQQIYKEIPKADVELSAPEKDAVVKESIIEGHALERQAEIPDIEMAKHDKFKMAHMKLPSFGFSKTEVSGDVHLQTVDVAVPKPDADINVPAISADVTSAGLKLPEADLAVSGKPPAVDIKDYSMDVGAPEVHIDMKVKGTELEGQGSKFKLPKFGISLPKAKGPTMDITMSKPDVDISLTQVKAEAKLPGVEVEGPSVKGTVDIPEVDSKDVDIKLKRRKLSLPKFGFSKPEITDPKISGNLNLPSVDIAVTKADADINVPDISADVPSAGVKLPEADLAVSGKLPAVDIKGYSMDVEAPEVDIDMKAKGTDLEGQGSKFKLPKFGISLPKAKGPTMDITVSKPDVDISLPQVTAEAKLLGVEVEGPSVEGTVDIPEVDSKDVDIKLKKAKKSFPKFGFSKHEMTAPKISGNLNLPSVDIAVSKPDADINVPAISADVTSAGVKLPEADLAVSGKLPAVDIKDYSMDVEAPEVNIDMKVKGTALEGRGSKFKLPKFGISLPKAKEPAMDITVSKPDVDISLPHVTAEAKLPCVEVEGPSVEGTLDVPEVDSKDVDIKLKKAKISLPKFGFSKPEMTTPKISGNLNLPSVDIAVTKPHADIKVPDISADVTLAGVKLPEADLAVSGKRPAVDIKGYSLDVEAPEVDLNMKVKDTELEGQGSKFKLPKFGISLPKAKEPAMDITVSKPDVDISLPQVTAEAKLPGVEVEGPSVEGTVDIPEVDSKGVDIKQKKTKTSFPWFGFSKPEITTPKTSGNLNLPSVDIAVTKPEADIKVPDISADVTSPGVKLPDADRAVSGKLPAVDIKDYSMDVEAPEVNIDMKVKGSELEGQGSKFKLPKFGISLPQAKGPAMDITVSKPDVDISLPQGTAEGRLLGIEVEGPSVEGTVDIPEVDSKGVDIKQKKTKTSFPWFGFSKPEITAHLPSLDIAVTKPEADIKVPDISADVTLAGVKLPEADLAVSGKLPAVDIKDYSMDVEAPEVNIDMKVKGTELEGQGSKFKLPKFGISLPQAKEPAMDITVSKPDVDISLPQVTAEGKLPGVEVEGPAVEGTVDILKVDSKGVDIKLKKPKTSFPWFGFSKPEIIAPKLSENLNLPSVDIAVTKPEADIKVPDISADVTLAGVKLPEADLAVSGKLPAVDIKDYSMNVEVPEVNIDMKVKGTELEGQGSKFKLPKFGISLPQAKEPAMDITVSKPDVDISLPQVTAEGKLPGVEVEGPAVEGTVDILKVDSKGVDIKLKKPKTSFPWFGFSKPEIIAPKLSENLNLPSVDIAVTKPEADIKVPDINADVTLAGVKLPEADLAVSGKLPAVDIKDYSMNVEVPEVNIDMKVKGTELEGQGSKFKLPKFGISLPQAKEPAMDITLSKPDVDISLPQVTAEGKLPAVEVEGPSMEGTVDIPEVDSKGVDIKLKKTKISFPWFGFSKPEITAPKTSGDLNLPSVDIAVTKPEADIKVPDISADVTSAGMKFPEADLAVSGKLPAVDIKDYSMDVETPEVDIDIKVKGTELEGQGSKFKLPKFGISLPQAKEPAMDITVSKPDVDISLPQVTSEGQLPGVEVKGPSLEGTVDIAEVDSKDVDINLKKPKISFPWFGFSKPDVKAAEVDTSFPKGDISIAGERVDVKEPEMDIKIPDIDDKDDSDIKGSPSKFKVPTFKFPKFGITAPKVKAEPDIIVPDISADVTSAAVKLPEVDVALSAESTAVDIKDYSMDIKSPDLDIDMKGKSTELEGQGSIFTLPKFGISFPKAKGPAVDITMSHPDVDISLPEVTAEAKLPGVEVQGPSVKGTVDILEVDSEEVDVKVKKPKIYFPKFGFSKQDATAPEIDTSFPKGDISIGGERVDVKEPGMDIKIPDIDDKDDSDIKGSPSKFKVPTFKFPKFGITAPKVKAEAPDLSVKIMVPDMETLSGKAIIDHEGTIMENGKAEGKSELPKMKIPNIDVKVHTLNGQDMSQEIPKAEYEICGPDTVKVDLKGSSLEGQPKIPDIEVGAVDQGRFKMPRIKFPSFGFSKPEITAPIISGNLNLPSGDIAVTKPDTDIIVPHISADVTSAGVKLPEADLAVSGKLPAIDIKGDSMDVVAPEVGIDMKGTELEVQGSRFKLPKFGISLTKAKGPEMDITVSKPAVDISLPQVTAESKLPGVEVEGPSVEGTVNIPAVDSKDVDIKLKKPKISFPKFGFSKPEIIAPKISGNLNLQSVDIAVTKPDPDIIVPHISADVTSAGVKLPEADLAVSGKLPAIDIKGDSMDVVAPEVGIDMKGTELEGQGSRFKLPKFGITFQKTKGPDVDVSVSKPDVDISLPQVTAEGKLPGFKVEGPSVEGTVDMPEVDSKEVDVKLKKPMISFPKFGFSKPDIKVPAIDVNLQKGDISLTEGSVEVKGPEVNIKASDTQIEGQDTNMDITGSETKFKLATFKFPTFSLVATKSNVEAQEVSADTTVPEIKASLGKAEVDIIAPVLETDALSTELEKSEGTGKFPNLKMTSIDISLPKGQGSESKPEDEISAMRPEGKTDVPELEATGTALEAKADISDPKPEVDIKGSSSKFKLPTFEMPTMGFSTAKVKTKDTDVDTGIKTPEVPFEGATKEMQESIDDGTSNITEPDKKTGDAAGQTQSSGFSLSNVFRGFDLEFHVPTLEEVEETLASPRQDVAHSGEIKLSTHTSTEKYSTIKYQSHTEQSQIQLSTSHGTEVFVQAPTIIKEAEAKEQSKFQFSWQGFTESSEQGDKTESTVTSEQPGPFVVSPTKVKVKISEPTDMVGVSEVKLPTHITTSTARTELIVSEHHLPEEVDTVTIDVSSEATLTSSDEKTQETGDIHVITSNIQATPSSEHAMVITKYETHSVQTSSLQKMTTEVESASWSVEGSGEWPSESSEENILVEKHVVKEKSGGDKEAVIITQRVKKVVSASSGEPISADTGSPTKKKKKKKKK